MYFDGEGVPENNDEAVKWYRLAAEQGHAKSQHRLGRMYSTGEGVSENDAEAVKWYRLAAEQGYAPAQLNLGDMYSVGNGVPQDYAEATQVVPAGRRAGRRSRADQHRARVHDQQSRA